MPIVIRSSTLLFKNGTVTLMTGVKSFRILNNLLSRYYGSYYHIKKTVEERERRGCPVLHNPQHETCNEWVKATAVANANAHFNAKSHKEQQQQQQQQQRQQLSGFPCLGFNLKNQSKIEIACCALDWTVNASNRFAAAVDWAVDVKSNFVSVTVNVPTAVLGACQHNLKN